MTSFPQQTPSRPITPDVVAPAPKRSPRRPAPAPARPRHLRVVRGRSAPGRRPPAAAVIIAGLATAAALFALVSVQSLVGQTEIKKAEISKRISHEKDQLDSLQVDVSNLSSLDRISARAAELGLVPPASITFLTPPVAGSDSLNLAELTVPSFVSAQQAPVAPAANQTAPSAPPSAHPSSSPATAGRGH